MNDWKSDAERLNKSLSTILEHYKVKTYRIENDFHGSIEVWVSETYDNLYVDLCDVVPSAIGLTLKMIPPEWDKVVPGDPDNEITQPNIFAEPAQFKGLEAFRPNPVSHPSHYNSGKIEVIEAIEDWGLNFHRGNAVKYTARAGKKDPTKECEDLEKAVWYLNREIEVLKAARESREPIKPNNMVKR